jgi:hypothetical protein
MGMLLSPCLEQLVAEDEKLRILDLGCASGASYDLLPGIKRQDVNTSRHDANVTNPKLIDTHLGSI